MSTSSPTLPLARAVHESTWSTTIWKTTGAALAHVVAAIIAHRQAGADAEIARRMAWRR
jgi:hypothetical protein